MIRAYHAIFSAYGFWLPNDPRGSWSEFVRSWELLRFGGATRVSTRQSLANHRHDRHRRRIAKQALQYPAVQFTGQQALTVSQGFRRAMEESGYVLYACSILPEHVHLVVGRHAHRIEQIVGHFKGRATGELTGSGLHPLAEHQQSDGTTPSPWARGCWRVYLNDDYHVNCAIKYVEQNPIREGKPRQNWSFVVPYSV